MNSHREIHFISLICLILSLVACNAKQESTTSKAVAIGLDGREFFEPKHTAEQINALNAAKKLFDADPSEENYIWYGRREAYLLRLKEAVAIYTEGLEEYPESYRLYRHRAHRYISMREFDKAIEDSQKAIEYIEGKPIETELDGVPNRLNIPKSTTQFNIWYHLGLAHYLKKEYEQAAQAYETCLKLSDNDDLLVATTDWLYMTYNRLGKKEEAQALLEAIKPQMGIVENESYHKRLLMYKGEYQPELLLALEEGGVDPQIAIATQGYGVGNWYLQQGDTVKAMDTFRQVVQGTSFTAFGFIAAEVDLFNLQK